jgi:aminoglycoside phosphotransferase (APT) family kinase protein
MDNTLLAWVESTTAGCVTRTIRPPVGGSRELYLVDVERSDGITLQLVLRCEAGGSFAGTEISPAKEASVYRALEHTEVPVPRVVALSPGNTALLMERLAGTADMSSLASDERTVVMEGFVDALAALHNLDVDKLDLPNFARPRTPEDHARFEISTWARLADDGIPEVDPMIRYSGAWLLAHPPTHVSRTVLVHGDAGPGNFLYDHTGVTGIVDWEFAHIGDPMDDWAWIYSRAAEAELEVLKQRYGSATGIPIDEDQIRYYRAAVDYRCAITTSLAVAKGGGARGLPPYLLVTERYVTALAAKMAGLLGLAESTEVPTTESTPRTSYFDALLDGIRSAVRALDDPELREATRNLQILVHYLRAHDQMGAEIVERDRSDRVRSIGREALDQHRFRALVEEAGACGDQVVFRYLLRRTARERQLWVTLLDRPRR